MRRRTQLIPARGRKQGCRQQHRRPDLRTQLIPARGRKPVPETDIILRNGTQLIPARGRKPSGTVYPPAASGHNLSPRGDGNLPGCLGGCRRSCDTTYPREGTETLQFLHHRVELLTQLIPARGRKHDGSFPLIHRGCDTTYPREGTETLTRKEVSRSDATQLIPARGRKPAASAMTPLHTGTQLIPARGRKPDGHRQGARRA